jgi:hypothetical protein
MIGGEHAVVSAQVRSTANVYIDGAARFAHPTTSPVFASDALTHTEYLPDVGECMFTVDDAEPRPSLPIRTALNPERSPTRPSSRSHEPRCRDQGCSPPGDALAISTLMTVAPAAEPGASVAVPLIWTTPASREGLAIVPCQRVLRYASESLIATTGAL